ncbi:hypothetical protein [Clostridium sp. AM58-1XD]|uniref:hypothetical protein n=1 Tax=Clostridium sp. AM58-1XD TaxID=2292307 RepID=UPI0015F57B40|nr:hypothetical protein [Clostridium sp. AM58-1XD]
MAKLIYEENDIKVVIGCLNSLTVTGIEAARRIATIATLLESGKPIDEPKGEEENGNL